MNIDDLRKPLKGNDLTLRVGRKVRGGSMLLVYKNARVDMERLDEVCGPGGWQRVHPHGPASCRVGIHIDGEWIWKEDVGALSNVDPEKGQASDSFKRACFNWGIGRELYEYPSIYVSHGDQEKIFPSGWDVYTKHNGKGDLTYLAIGDKGTKKFEWGDRNVGT